MKNINPFLVGPLTNSSETITVAEENTDMKDYLNSHKMLVEMDEIQNGELI